MTLPPLQQTVHCSPYLSQLLDSTGGHGLLQEPQKAVDAATTLLDEFPQLCGTDLADTQAFTQRLVQLKQRFTFALSIADLSRQLDTVEVGRLQTRFAELSLHWSLQAAWRAPGNAKLCKNLPPVPALVPGLFVLGFGKLGGMDLNFSSDVDLVAFFDPALLPVDPMQGKGHVCVKVLQTMTRILTGNGIDDLIWRIDWRLRPESSATQIAMSTDAASDYYHFRSMPWHRLALMKARPVAGDIATGEKFLHELDSYIWRQNLDFRALEELGYLKDRIDLEHPKLAVRGKRDLDTQTPPEGFNLKLGSGGIREIEFFANGLQLVWGGKFSALRTGHTVSALRELAANQIVEPGTADRLIEDYLWLRRLENRTQMLDNQQVHQIPAEPVRFQQFLQFSEFASRDQLVDELQMRRTRVHKEFDRLFRPANEIEETEKTVPEFSEMPERTREILQGWADGFRGYGVSDSQALRLRPLYGSIMREIARSSVAPVQAVDQLHAFFVRLPPGGQYLKLLQSSPNLLGGMIVPLIHSPPMQILLEQSPHIIDCLLQQGDFDPGWVLQAKDYDVRLERMRRQVNEELYQLYLQFIEGEIEPVAFQQLLTRLAIDSLNLGFRVVEDKLGSSPPVAVLGMGKLGMGRMAPMSDLDITFVSSNAVPLEQATRFVTRLNTALATRMREGVVYEMDTRLRPSGRSGAPTVSLASFISYQQERAKSWEHLALVASRAVAGDATLIADIDQAREAILSRPRDAHQLQMDAAKMLQRIRDQRITDLSDRVFSTKLRQGGLMETEYLISCAVVRLGAQHPHLLRLDYPDMVVQLGTLLKAETLPEILQYWRVMQLWERLLGLEGKTLDEVPDRFKSIICRHLNATDLDQIETCSQEFSQRVLKWLDAELGLSGYSRQELEQWQEVPVLWL